MLSFYETHLCIFILNGSCFIKNIVYIITKEIEATLFDSILFKKKDSTLNLKRSTQTISAFPPS